MTLAATPLARTRVVTAWDETPALRAIRLQLPREHAAAHERPGQLLKLHTHAGETYFAIASAPSAVGLVDLLVKRGGRVADAVVESATPGADLMASAPIGKGYPVEEAHGRDVLLFAAGSGIAPIRAIVQHVLANRALFGRVMLFYGQRHGADFAYTKEHAAWRRGGVEVVLCPSGEDEAWPGMRGRVQEVARSTALGGVTPTRAVAFVCGMTAMVDEVRATLAQSGVPPENVLLNF